MQPSESPASPEHDRDTESGGASALRIVLVIVAVFAVYQAVMYGVRRHVDGKIEASAGGRLFDFELEDMDGKVWRSAEFAGRKVVLNFFRSRCQGCRVEAPNVRELVRRVDPAKVAVIGIMMDEVQGYPIDATQKTLTDFGYEHPILMADAAFLDAFHGAGWAHVTPITYIANESGEIVAALRGHQRLDTLLAALE